MKKKARKYEDTKTYMSPRYKRDKFGNVKTNSDGSPIVIQKEVTRTKQRKGIKIVHIGKDIWKIGRDTSVKNKKHQVIYGPDDKNYHLWESDVDFVNTPGPNEPGPYYINQGIRYEQERRQINRDGCKAYESKVKIYILTHILDKKENWCFDLTKIPAIGKLKVMYANGTVRNIDFDGEFKKHFSPYSWSKDKTKGSEVEPFAYRLY